jgi:hypothetical protein
MPTTIQTELEAPSTPISPLPMPPHFTGKVSADEWNVLKKMVNSCGQLDANTKSRVAVP